MAKQRFTEGYAAGIVHTSGGNHRGFCETEGSDSSGQLDTEITASEDSNVIRGRSTHFKTERCRSSLSVPVQVLSLSKTSQSERKKLVLRLRAELEQIRLLQRQFEQRVPNGLTVSSSSDIISCGNVQNNVPTFEDRRPGIRENGESNRHFSGNGEPSNEALPQRMVNVMIMKQCEVLLKKLMSHQFGYMFNSPVDVVKHNIPDYFTVIKRPMDLGTIQSKIAAGSYSTPFDFLSDVRLTFSNAMTYNPRGNRVYFMAESLSKCFETKWKAIEKKITSNKKHIFSQIPGVRRETLPAKSNSVQRKRKFASIENKVAPKPAEKIMTTQEKLNLSKQLEGILGELPIQIVDFLKVNCSSARETGEDEIEIDINDMSNDALFRLQKLIENHLLEKKLCVKARPCDEREGPGNRSMQPAEANYVHENADNGGGSKLPVSSHVSETTKAANGKTSQCITFGCSDGDSESTWGFDHPELISEPQQFEYSRTSPPGTGVLSDKLYRAALLKNRFADTIFKAKEKTLVQGGKGDPDRTGMEKQALELLRKKERARLQEEANRAEEARRKAEAEALAEAKKKRQLEREAARMALHKMEKTVEINEGGLFLEDLENLRVGGVVTEKQQRRRLLLSSGDETSPGGGSDGFPFQQGNPLEQLGLYMKADDDEEDGFGHDIVNG